MPVFDLSQDGQCATFHLKEIQGRLNSVSTSSSLTRRGEQLKLVVNAEDPSMLDLLSTISAVGEDDFLYEEDCVQIATALPGKSEPIDFLLVNPHGSRKGSKAAERWPVETERHSYGWKLSIHIPVPPATPIIGFSLHRFFRGVHHEAQSITQTLPHPPDLTQFSALALEPVNNRDKVAEDFRQSMEQANEAKLRQQLSACRERIAKARSQDGPSVNLETAKRYALERSRHACEGLWNETYLQHALIDLWELEQNPVWLEMAIPRMEEAWETRANRVGRKDTLWGRVLPTWYFPKDGSYAMTLVSGVMLHPIARLMQTVFDDPTLQGLQARIEPWIPLCRQVIDTHDAEWVELTDDTGFYLEPYEKGPRRVYPSGGSRLNPLNRGLWFAMPMLHLGRILNDEKYLRRARQMARYFKANCETLSNGSLVWEYAPSRYPATGEDISHAHIQVLFAELSHKEGIVFDDLDLKKIAVTLEKNIFKHGGVPCETIRGFHPGIHLAVGAWSGLCRFVPQVFPQIEAVVETVMKEGKFNFATEGWAVRNLTLVEKARKLQPLIGKP